MSLAGEGTPRLRLEGVQKSFGATRALRGVSLQVAPGEVHAIIGENGAGKSTLMKILSGACRADAGEIQLDGLPFCPATPRQALLDGVAMIYQELNLAPDLSVEENILLGTEPSRFGVINQKERSARAHAALAELGHGDIPLQLPIRRCTIAQQQVVEIARALLGQPRVVIMDEPTSSLTRVDVDKLFKVVETLSARGVTVLYISHFLEECKKICSRFTVLRDGQSVLSGDMCDTALSKIIQAMVGREIAEIYPKKAHRVGEPVLEVKQLSGLKKPRRVSVAVRRGEIFGIAGLIGAGRTETVRCLFGLDKLKAGAVVLSGEDVTDATPRNRLDQKIGLLSENRKEEGLMLQQSIADNLTASNYRAVSSLGIVSSSKQEASATKWMRHLEVKASSPSQLIHQLSGGNQQKVAIARLLHHEVEVFLLDEPTRGIDVGSKAKIYELMGELAEQGKSILFISSYIPELLGVCDTIAVMCRGEVVAVKPAVEWTEHAIIREAIGEHVAGTPQP
jgi:ribose transport system ATP-binding protein